MRIVTALRACSPGLREPGPAAEAERARQRGGKLGLLTVAADDRHVGGQVHAHTQPHALLTAWVVLH